MINGRMKIVKKKEFAHERVFSYTRLIWILYVFGFDMIVTLACEKFYQCLTRKFTIENKKK